MAFLDREMSPFSKSSRLKNVLTPVRCLRVLYPYHCSLPFATKLNVFSTGRFTFVVVVVVVYPDLGGTRPGRGMVQGPRPRLTSAGQDNILGYFR